MDVKNIYLNGDLVEEVYIWASLDYTHPSNKVECPQSTIYFFLVLVLLYKKISYKSLNNG